MWDGRRFPFGQAGSIIIVVIITSGLSSGRRDFQIL